MPKLHGFLSDLFIMGCGRSGTSLVTGLFRNAGFYMGDNLYSARNSNPKGFFEDYEVNELNEDLLAPLLPDRQSVSPKGYGWDIPVSGQRWLSRVPDGALPVPNADQLSRLRALTSRKPFCFKDPRFCYTLDPWREFAFEPKFICVFRDPAHFVASVFTECREVPYLQNLAISVAQLLEIWTTMYSRVLNRHAKTGPWIFVEYDQILAGPDQDRLGAFTGIELDRTFADRALDRSRSELRVPEAVSVVLSELRRRAAEPMSCRSTTAGC